MTLQARLPQPSRARVWSTPLEGDRARRPPASAVISEPEVLRLPGGVTQWLTPAAGIVASISRRVW